MKEITYHFFPKKGTRIVNANESQFVIMDSFFVLHLLEDRC